MAKDSKQKLADREVQKPVKGPSSVTVKQIERAVKEVRKEKDQKREKLVSRKVQSAAKPPTHFTKKQLERAVKKVTEEDRSQREKKKAAPAMPHPK